MAEFAFIAIGSNIDPEHNLPQAVALLKHLGAPVRVSGVYQNPALGDRNQPDFLNAAMMLEVEEEPEKIRQRLRTIEARLGRERTEDEFAPRTIDLDLVMLGDRVLQRAEITLPDPELLFRPHLAVPIAELAPDHLHPESGEPMQAIADRLRPGAELHLRKDLTRRIAEIVAGETQRSATGAGG